MIADYQRVLLLITWFLSLGLVACHKTTVTSPSDGQAIRIGRYVPDENDKEYWAKNSQKYVDFVWGEIVTAQRTLARFGYGTTFTGEMDERTTAALIEYQKHTGLPTTGDLDERTRRQLSADRDAFREPLGAGGTGLFTSHITDASLAADCMKNGTLAFERYKADLTERYNSMAGPGKPEFHFNKRLNTCLMKVDHLSFIPLSGLGPFQLNSIHEEEIIDVYSNRSLLKTTFANEWDSSTRQLGGRSYGIDRDKFEVEAKKMMSE